MKFYEIRQFDVPGINLTEGGIPGTDPVTGRPVGTKQPSIWDAISGVLKGADKKKPNNKPVLQGAAYLNPLKNMRPTQGFKGRVHQGVDLRATVGTPVYAPEDGVVKLLTGKMAGLYIELATATGLHKFMHLSTYSVANGAQVKAGTEIGLTGNTGFSTAPHLHWEYWVNGQATDPAPGLKEGTLGNIASNALKKIAQRQHLDFDALYGKVFKITDNAGNPNNPGFSIVTPLNGEAWNWAERPEFKEIVKQRLNDPAFIGDHKYQQIIDAMSGNKFDPAMHQMKEGALADIASNVWKKIAGTAEKEIPRIEPTMGKPTSATPTPIRDPDQTPRPTPVYTTPKQGSTFYALAAKTAKAEAAGLKLYDLPGTQDKIVQIANRPIVVVDIDGFAAPFYVSTGGGGKAGVPTGKWYPFFGIGSRGWFNKGWTEEQINNYYGNAKLASVAQKLDSTMGDMRNLAGEMEPGNRALGVINAGKRPYPSHEMTVQEQRAYEQYITQLVNSI